MKRHSSIHKRRRKNKSKKYTFVYLAALIVGVPVFIFIYELGQQKAAKNWVEKKADNTQLIFFPQDDGYHKHKMEWWYFNGYLLSEDGTEYGFHHSVFLINNLTTHTVIHSSLSDYQTKKVYAEQTRVAGNLSSDIVSGINFNHAGFFVQGNQNRYRLSLEKDDFSFDLEAKNSGSEVLHGINGILELEPHGSSYYYSRPRMEVEGNIHINGVKHQVSGTSWFDHQWGDFNTTQLSWDWFSLQLDSGANIMIYQIRDLNQIPVNYTLTYSKDSNVEVLKNHQFNVKATDYWVSPKTKIKYPLHWNIKIPDKQVDINLSPEIIDSEFDGRVTSYHVYWEGAVNVKGSATGRGYMELNYRQ